MVLIVSRPIDLLSILKDLPMVSMLKDLLIVSMPYDLLVVSVLADLLRDLLIDRFNIEQNHQVFNVKQAIKCEILSLKTTIANERKKTLAVGYSNANAP